METLYFATSNSWKFNQAKGFFEKQGIKIEQFEVDIDEPREADGGIVAHYKAVKSFKKIKKPLFVVDGAFCIKALKDFPKSYVKFFDEYIGAEGLIKLLKEEKDRRWEFHNYLFYKDKDTEKLFDGITKGVISKDLVPADRIMIRDFERIMIPEGYEKTFSQMTVEEYNERDEKKWKTTVFGPFIKWYKEYNKNK